MDTELAQDMVTCNPDGVLMVHITKLYPSSDALTFSALGRVFSGTLTKGMAVAVRQQARFDARFTPLQCLFMSFMVVSWTFWLELTHRCLVSTTR